MRKRIRRNFKTMTTIQVLNDVGDSGGGVDSGGGDGDGGGGGVTVVFTEIWSGTNKSLIW